MQAPNTWSPKDPDEVKDYSFNWSDMLPNDQITSSTWSIVGEPSDLVISTPSYTAKATRFWASGGTAGKTYEISNLVETQGGRTYERTRPLVVKEL